MSSGSRERRREDYRRSHERYRRRDTRAALLISASDPGLTLAPLKHLFGAFDEVRRLGLGIVDLSSIIEADGSRLWARRMSHTEAATPGEILFPVVIAAFTGARIGEILDCPVCDIEELFGLPCVRIREDNREPGQWIKGGNEGYSKRDAPLHPAILGLGFLAYVAEIKAAGHTALFPQYRKDRHNARKENGSKVIRAWIKSLGVIPEAVEGTNGRRTIKPMHSMRNYVQTWFENNEEQVPLKTRCAITGHTVNGEWAKYTEVAVKSMARAIEKLPNPFKAKVAAAA